MLFVFSGPGYLFYVFGCQVLNLFVVLPGKFMSLIIKYLKFHFTRGIDFMSLNINPLVKRGNW